MMTVRTPRALIALLLSTVLLGACATPLVPREKTYDKITDEINQARKNNNSLNSTKPTTKPADTALLPPLFADNPRQRNRQRSETRFDLAVSEAPAASVFMAMVSGTRYSMLLPNDLEGVISVNLKNVTVREALEAIRDLYGYEYRVRGTRITIIPNTIQTRMFQVSYLAGKRGGMSSTRVSSTAMPNVSGTGSASNTSSSENANVYTGVVSDFWQDLGQAVATILDCTYTTSQSTLNLPSGSGAAQTLSAQGFAKPTCKDGRNFIINSQSGVVMVRAMPSELREVKNLIKALQANVERQVMIEAKILEVQLTDDFNTGINWSSFDKFGRSRWGVNSSNAINTRNATDGTRNTLGTLLNPLVRPFAINSGVGAAASNALGLSFQTGDFTAIIDFLSTQGQVYVMSSPRIATLNNQKAVIKVGVDDYYITRISSNSSNSSTGNNTTNVTMPTIDVAPLFSGIALDVTPQIGDEGLITLHIRPMVTEVSDKNKTVDLGTTLGTFTIPYASTKVKESDSIVRVRDGMIVAIGGLMSESQNDNANKIPGAGDIPVLGHFFKQTGRAMLKREMVILLKPTVIESVSDWDCDMEGVQDRLEDYDPRKLPRGQQTIF